MNLFKTPSRIMAEHFKKTTGNLKLEKDGNKTMTITFYELLGLVKDGKAPKKIKYDDFYCYYDEEKNKYVDYAGVLFFEWEHIVMNSLNNTVEIIEEENKIKKLYHCCMESDNEEIKFLIKNINDLSDKINELMDEINKLKEKQ